MNPIPVQCNISGFSGPPCTLLSVYDPATGALLAHKIEAYNTARIDGCLVVGTDLRTDLDAHFTAEMLGEAITAFEAVSARLTYGTDAMRAKPDGAYETDGYDENGPKRRIADGISNAKIAVLATCWGIAKQDNTIAAARFMEQVSSINRSGFDGFDPYMAFTI